MAVKKTSKPSQDIRKTDTGATKKVTVPTSSPGRVSQDIRKPVTSSGTATKTSTSSSTYKPKDSSGNDYAGLSNMSAVHRAALEAAGREYNAATTEEGRIDAHQKAEDIRALYDYSGGDDGSEYIPVSSSGSSGGGKTSGSASSPGMDLSELAAILGMTGSAGSAAPEVKPIEKEPFSYESAPEYTDRYQKQIDQLLSSIMDREPFSYDAESDPLYQQYREQYRREGERAMQDTLGQVSARTGGLASSWASTAAQQQRDYYASQAADKIPELYRLAYSMYMDEADQDRQNLGLLWQASTDAYGRYRDSVADWRSDRDLAYQQYQDDIANQRYNQQMEYQAGRDQVSDQRYNQQFLYQALRDLLSDQRYNQQFDYQAFRDQISDQRYDKQFDYQAGRDQVSDSRYDQEWSQSLADSQYQKELLKAQTLAQSGDFSGYASLGYTQDQISALQADWQRQQALAQLAASGTRRSSSGTSRSSGKASSSETFELGDDKWKAVEDWTAIYGKNSAENYIREHYRELGYDGVNVALAGWANYKLKKEKRHPNPRQGIQNQQSQRADQTSGTGSANTNTSSGNTSSGNIVVDFRKQPYDLDSAASVCGLPIDEAKLKAMIETGLAEQYEENGVIRFRRIY